MIISNCSDLDGQDIGRRLRRACHTPMRLYYSHRGRDIYTPIRIQYHKNNEKRSITRVVFGGDDEEVALILHGIRIDRGRSTMSRGMGLSGHAGEVPDHDGELPQGYERVRAGERIGGRRKGG